MRNPLHVTVWFQLSVPSFTPEFEHYVLNMQSAFWSKHGHRAVNLHSVVTHALSCYDNKSWVILSFIRNKVLTGSCSLLCSVHVVKFTYKTRLMQSRCYKTPAKSVVFEHIFNSNTWAITHKHDRTRESHTQTRCLGARASLTGFSKWFSNKFHN